MFTQLYISAVTQVCLITTCLQHVCVSHYRQHAYLCPFIKCPTKVTSSLSLRTSETNFVWPDSEECMKRCQSLNLKRTGQSEDNQGFILHNECQHSHVPGLTPPCVCVLPLSLTQAAEHWQLALCIIYLHLEWNNMLMFSHINCGHCGKKQDIRQLWQNHVVLILLGNIQDRLSHCRWRISSTWGSVVKLHGLFMTWKKNIWEGVHILST